MKHQKFEWDKIALSYMSGQIFDIGCGEGRFISHRPKTIVGIDSNKQSVEICKEKGFDVFFGRTQNFPVKDNSFNAVHCSHVIEHLMPEDAHKLLLEMDRVLKVRGIFCIRAPLLWKGFYHDFTHIKPYYPEAILRYMINGKQKTLGEINGEYKVLELKYRMSEKKEKTGFMLILKKIK